MARARVIGFLSVLALALAACGGGDDGGETAADQTTTQETAEPVTVDLAEEHDSGQSGTATLTPVKEGAIPTYEVVLQLEPPLEGPFPAHVHNVTCAEFAAEVKTTADIEATIVAALSDVRNGESKSTAPGSLAERTTGEYSINVHDPAKQFETVACGDIPSAE
jgi:hypothetical protein